MEFIALMDSRTPDLFDLLGKRAHVIRARLRLRVRKRIVEFERQTYVLHFFLSGKIRDRFEATLRRLDETGIRVQHVCAGSAGLGQALRTGGHCLALTYLPGTPLTAKAHPETLAALGRTLAALNTIEGPACGALFDRRRPVLPHEAYLAEIGEARPPEDRRWIEDSLARMGRLPANQLTHGDLYNNNIIEQEDRSVGLIDYEAMAYDVSGIELAATLMRPFCRQPAQRRSLLQAYLAACPAPLSDIWQSHATDLLFTATIRLLAGRQKRIRQLERRKRFLALLPPSMCRARREITARNMGFAALSEAYYRDIARTMVGLCRAEPGIDPVTLLEQCERLRRKPT